MSMKRNKVKCNKTRFVCTQFPVSVSASVGTCYIKMTIILPMSHGTIVQTPCDSEMSLEQCQAHAERLKKSKL